MGPGIVSLLTWLTGNQRIGMGGIGFMFLAGLIILWKVHAPKAWFRRLIPDKGRPAS